MLALGVLFFTMIYFYINYLKLHKVGFYVVTAHRWGDSETHNYIVGVFSTLSKAETAAASCEYERGIKYECRISRVMLDKGGGHKEVIKKIWDDHPENYLKKFEKE